MTLTSSATSTGLAGQLLIDEVLRRLERQPERTLLDRVLGHSPIAERDLPWYLGAKGERVVGAVLGRLPQGWAVLHSLPIGHAADIDHIVIGPGGVFVVSTKHHPGKKVWVAGHGFLVSGRRLPYMGKAGREADRVTETLASAGAFGIPVEPIIVLVGVASLTVRSQPDVPVLEARRLLSWLASQPQRLEAEAVQELVRRLSRADLWADTRPHVAHAGVRFGQLDAQVRAASVVRRLWTVGIVGAAVWCGMIAVPSAMAALTLTQ
jgi:hypothetical protein